MLKLSFKGFVVILGLIIIYGCASTKDVEVKRYVEVKDRVDQNMEFGNAGFISGTPQPEDRSNIRKTRKVYVVEVSKGGEIEDDALIVEENKSNTIDNFGYDDGYEENTYYDDAASETDNRIEVRKDDAFNYDRNVYSDDNNEPSTSSNTIEYTVQKDDTLQKISKKFYDSYSKWPRIYDANRGVLDNPDRIKPGVVIQIPSQ